MTMPDDGFSGGGSSLRLDMALVKRKLATSREKAKALIASGFVQVNGLTAGKASETVTGEDQISVTGQVCPYVSRGGLKLEAALSAFHLDPAGRICLDAGASTGGFTDCLLQHGARKVYAVDVGYGQLHQKLREDPRVVSLEKVNLRYLTEGMIPEKCSFLTCDVSFISLTLIFQALGKALMPGACCIFLIKPQFEAGRKASGKGVVRSMAVHEQVLKKVTAQAAAQGFSVEDLMACPLQGGDGNQEFLMHGEWTGQSGPCDISDEQIRKIVRRGE